MYTGTSRRAGRPDREVYCYDFLTGDYVGMYTSAKEAARVTGVSASGISRCCRGVLRSAGGMVWSFSAPGDAALEEDLL